MRQNILNRLLHLKGISAPRSIRRMLSSRLSRCRSGVAMIEFAMALPLLMIIGFYGVEVAYLGITQMRLSQVSLNLSDNASRMGTLNSSLGASQVSESQINDIFEAAAVQAENLDIYNRGRIVLSSIELDGKRQYLHWQRCKGTLKEVSAYGKENTYLPNTGIGKSDQKITATDANPVMFVELYYEYEPLFGGMFMSPSVLSHEAAYTVRDNRDLSGGPINDVGNSKRYTCDKYDNSLPSDGKRSK